MSEEILLANKLKLKSGLKAALLNAPDNYLMELAPEGVNLEHALSGKYDWIQLFIKNKAELDSIFPDPENALKAEAFLWISFPEALSKIQTDLTRDKGWDSVRQLKWIKLVSTTLSGQPFVYDL